MDHAADRTVPRPGDHRTGRGFRLKRAAGGEHGGGVGEDGEHGHIICETGWARATGHGGGGALRGRRRRAQQGGGGRDQTLQRERGERGARRVVVQQIRGAHESGDEFGCGKLVDLRRRAELDDAPLIDLGGAKVTVTPSEKRHSATIYC